MDRREFVSNAAAAAAAVAAWPGDAAAAATEERLWEKLRKSWLIPDDVLYLNNGSVGATPKPVLDAVERYQLEVERFAGRRYGEYPWWGYPDTTLEWRARVGAFVGAEADEIALTRNATEAMCTVASGLDLNAGDEVLISDQEHPGGKSAWLQRAKRYGIVVREFTIGMPPESPAAIVQRVADALTPRTRVISVSHITTITGGMLPVKEICALARAKGIVSLVDGAHTLGQLPVDVKEIGCDYYAVSQHKWLFAPKGTGALYCRKGMAERLWCHTPSVNWDKPELGVERLSNIGTTPRSTLIGLGAAIDLYEKVGGERIVARHRFLTHLARERLSAIPGLRFITGSPPELAVAMVRFTLPFEKFSPIAMRLWDRHKIWVAPGDADPVIPLASARLSFPYYILPRHIERAVEVLRKEIAA